MFDKIQKIAGKELHALIRGQSEGTRLQVDPAGDFCSSLELLLPSLLAEACPQWSRESLDGIFVAEAIVCNARGARMAGTVILISDQTVTPFELKIFLKEVPEIAAIDLSIGEAGGGHLGISGPACNSRGAAKLLEGVPSRIDSIDWVYQVSHRPTRHESTPKATEGRQKSELV